MFTRISLHSLAIPASLCVFALLTGCQTPAPAPLQLPAAQLSQLQQWQGHFSIKLGPWRQLSADGQSFTFYLQAGSDTGQLDLMTPLGTQLAQVNWTPQGSRVQSSEGTQQFDSIGAMSQQLLGEEVPLLALPYWLQGIPSPDLPSASVAEDHSGFQQAGWHITTVGLGQGRLIATRPASPQQRDISIRIRLER